VLDLVGDCTARFLPRDEKRKCLLEMKGKIYRGCARSATLYGTKWLSICRKREACLLEP